MIEAFVMLVWGLVGVAIAFSLLWDELKETRK
jgi:hypothetical protein